MANRTCIIHIGVHKTGTTSQQYFLMDHAQTLARHGLLFPKTGWYGVVPGHHGVAWELLERDDGPIFSALLEEMNAFEGPAAIISAEDFSLFGAARQGALDTLARGLRSIGYAPKVLVYLRAQAQFAESMYVERVKHGFLEPISRFMKDVVETGRYQPAGALLPIEIRFSRMLAPFDSVFGRENITAGIYEGRGDITRVFNDFINNVFKMAGIPVDQLSLEISHPLINESLSFIRLLGTVFVHTHPGENVAATARGFANEFAPDLPPEYIEQRFALLRREDYLAILNSVVADNQTVLREYGARIPFLSDREIPGPSDAIWAKAHSERKIYDRCLNEWL